MTMETLADYFEHRNTPSASSPVGLAMVELLNLEPSLTFEEARKLVNEVGAGTSSGPKECARRASELVGKHLAAA
jgi:hypothetical protein